tara:strand:+ start:1074 stop:1316 length:243 start_codon:yes stop_codon:yes gene_type:complete
MKKNTKQYKENLYQMLISDSMAKAKKAVLTLDLMTNSAVGIGDHSTDDFYNNVKDAIKSLTDAEDEIETINNYFLRGKYD